MLHADDRSGLIPTNPVYFYYATTMTEKAYLEVTWWKEYLSLGPCAICRPLDLLVLATTWGDSSGTGTGGTFRLISSAELAQSDKEWWMGVWTQHTLSSSSNWKEL
eukprot:10099695-Ditylum_brightwellii.AAC.1